MAIPLDPKIIPKYINQLPVPPVYEPVIVTDPNTGVIVSQDYTISVNQFKQQILPLPLPDTNVWGYSGIVKDPVTGLPVFYQNSPGATFEATTASRLMCNG